MAASVVYFMSAHGSTLLQNVLRISDYIEK